MNRHQPQWNIVEQEALELFRELLKIDTSNPPGKEEGAVELLAQFFKSKGINFYLFEPEKGRKNLVVRLESKTKGQSLLLDAHTDVVPAGVGWTRPPFEARIVDGFVWGRGALDMKHAVAMSAVVTWLMAEKQQQIKGDLVFAATADEETSGQLGAEWLVDNQPHLVATDFALGEVGGMTVWLDNNTRIYPVQVAQKGVCWVKFSVYGEGGHGSIPRTDSVPIKLARLVQRLSSLSFPLSPTPASKEFFSALAKAVGGIKSIVLGLATNPSTGGLVLEYLIRDKKQAQTFKSMLKHTVNPTVISCGTSPNVVPKQGYVIADCRILPGMKPDRFVNRLRQELGSEVKIELLESKMPISATWNTRLFQIIHSTVQEMDPGAKAVPYLMSGYTNGAAYARLGTTYYGFTPLLLPFGFDAISLFHNADERCPISGFKWGIRTLFKVVDQFLCGI